MAVKIIGIEATVSTFREIDKRFTEAAGNAVEEGAKAISALARRYAPVDTGDLVRSIRAQRVSDSGSTRWRVKVGGNGAGHADSNYAEIMHENLAITTGERTNVSRPMYNPRKKSRAKAASSGDPVGGHFLQRAFAMLAPKIVKDIRLGLKNELSHIARSFTRGRLK